jgi:hypothetical protein
MTTEPTAAPEAAPAAEPLGLPRGSVRALVGVAMAACCWVLIFTGRQVPTSLLGLTAAILGYYFGLRTKQASPAGQTAAPRKTPARRQPLGLPAGVIRLVLCLGFVASGVMLLVRGKLADLAYVEFFLVLMGLVVGYLTAKLLRGRRRGPVWSTVNHVKGAVVLAITAVLAVWFLVGFSGGKPALPTTIMCAAVSFYFGSRS